jgi:hypothetical protein
MQAFMTAYSLSRHPAKGFQSPTVPPTPIMLGIPSRPMYISTLLDLVLSGALHQRLVFNRPSSYLFRCTAPPWLHTNPVKGFNLCPILPPMPHILGLPIAIAMSISTPPLSYVRRFIEASKKPSSYLIGTLQHHAGLFWLRTGCSARHPAKGPTPSIASI